MRSKFVWAVVFLAAIDLSASAGAEQDDLTGGIVHRSARIYWYAEAGESDAQNLFGLLHIKRDELSDAIKQKLSKYGVPTDPNVAEALKCIWDTPDSPYHDVMKTLEQEQGPFTKHRMPIPNNRKAVQWLRKSADQGYAAAMCNLGIMTAAGLGIAQDEKEADGWIQRSAAQGYLPAQKILNPLYGAAAPITAPPPVTENVNDFKASDASDSVTFEPSKGRSSPPDHKDTDFDI